MAPRKTAAAPKVPDKWRNRIVGWGVTTAAEIHAHPDNPRIHGQSQRAALTALLDDVGFVAPIVVNRLSGRLIDGHMRVEETPEGEIPVAYVELDDNEEREVLAMMDPIGAMAGHDAAVLADLTEGLTLAGPLEDVLSDLLPNPDSEPNDPIDIELRPLTRAHVLVSVPLDAWDQAAPFIDQLAAIAGVEINQTVK